MSEFELLNRVLSDPLPQKKVDGLYLFCQTDQNESAVLESAVALYHLGITDKLFLMNSEAMSGYPGEASWTTYITNHGVKEEDIEKIEPDDKNNLHTLIEARSLVQHAIDHNYQHIILMSSSFHQLRAFLTAVTALNSLNGNIAFYSQPGKPLDWDQSVAHSQGSLVKQRKALIYTELERMKTYQEKGDLLPFQSGIDYLDKRAEIVNSLEL